MMLKKNIRLYSTLVFLLAANTLFLPQAYAQKEKGLLPEINRADGGDANDNKTVASEILITKSEEKAIAALERIIKKNKGSAQEADLYNRLAELYMRRSKSGRFFDLQRESTKVQKAMTMLPKVPSSGKDYIRKAIVIYNKIQTSFPKYPMMDEVLFNNAFAHQQTDQTPKSLELYQSLITRFPQSRYIPEAYMGRGEIYYNSGNFQASLKELMQLEKFKDSKVYLYGMYKAAWAYYNLKDSQNAVGQLLVVLKNETEKYNLRKETMKDLVLFTSDFYQVDDIYPFFKKHALNDEIDQVILDFASLYESHSRYKELNSLMKDYLKDQPLSPIAVRLEIYFAENYESMKNRKDVIKHVEIAQTYCAAKSDWAKKVDQDVFEESCHTKLKSFQAELIIKWWEIWQKNKAHPEFNELLISLLRVAVINENLAEKDKKTRYLLAEILFHNQKYLEASEQYQLVADKSEEKKLRHDSYYSALFAYEKYLESKPKLEKKAIQEKLYVLSEQYLTFSPQGEHADNVKLKLATIYLERKDFRESEKYLASLFSSKDKDVQLKAQDIQLEIYNIQKDFKKLKDFSAQLSSKEKDQGRRQSFDKIAREAEFNDIVLADPKEEKLLAYARANKSTDLGKQALWQVLTKTFQEKRDADAMKYGEEYVDAYPKDKEVEKIQKELFAIYLEYGFFEKAALLQSKNEKQTNEVIEKIGDYYQMENQWTKAHDRYTAVLQKFQPGGKDYQRIFEKIQFLSNNDPRIKTDKLVQQLVQKGIEPFATRYLVTNAQRLLEDQKYPQAFDAARKINGRDVPNEEKFLSRMIQAQVLEKEFFAQSIKSSADRLSLVLAIKTEKFDKAFTSYNDALKMTANPERQTQALLGVNRSFEHFISSLENIVLPSELSAQEQTELKSELSQLVKPLQERREENQVKISQIQNQGSGTNMSSVLALVSEMKGDLKWPQLLPNDSNFDSYKIVETQKKVWKNEELLADLNKSNLKPWSLFRLAVNAQNEGKFEKALFLAQSIPSKNNDFITYLRGVLNIQREYFSAGLSDLDKMLNKKYEIDEFKILSAFKAFSAGDFLSASEDMVKIKKYKLTDLHLMPVYVDSLVSSGQSDKAVSFLKNALKNEKSATGQVVIKEKLTNLESKRAISSEKDAGANGGKK